MKPLLRIATRRSQLALWQAEHVADRLRDVNPGLDVALVPMSTSGDLNRDVSLASIGGKGLFVKELEQALLREEAEIAVHSMKDVPSEIPERMCIAAVVERADPRDALISKHYGSLDDLPADARVGTSSLRRQCQLLHHYPELRVEPLRGNVDTRLKRLERGEYDAILLAAAGLQRLGLSAHIKQYLPPEVSLPAIGQGIIGIECREDDTSTRQLLEPIEHRPTRCSLEAERAVAIKLEGSCHSPIAGFAEIHDNTLSLRALVGLPDGSRLVSGSVRGDPDDAQRLGAELGEDLLNRGAADILRLVGDG